MTLSGPWGISQHGLMWRQLDNPQYMPLCRGFSLLELMLVLALLSVLVWVAVPRYGAQQVQGRSAAMQLELMACAQALHALAFSASPRDDHPWLLLADADGDGDGDSASGAIANTICDISSSTRNDFTITVVGDQGRFELRAEPATGAHSDTLTLDHLGRQSWFDDE